MLSKVPGRLETFLRCAYSMDQMELFSTSVAVWRRQREAVHLQGAERHHPGRAHPEAAEALL